MKQAEVTIFLKFAFEITASLSRVIDDLIFVSSTTQISCWKQLKNGIDNFSGHFIVQSVWPLIA